MLKTLCFVGCLLISIGYLWAQDPSSTPPVEMADMLRQSGKIYVVIASILLIFIGIVLFLFKLERRLKQLENEK